MEYAPTTHNRIVNTSPPYGGSGCVRLGRSLRSLPRLTAPQFASPGLAPQALIRAGKPSFTDGKIALNTTHLIKYYQKLIFLSTVFIKNVIFFENIHYSIVTQKADPVFKKNNEILTQKINCDIVSSNWRVYAVNK